MKITAEVYEFVPRCATIELSGLDIKPEEVKKLRNKRVTIVLRNVCLESGEFYHIGTKLEFFGG